MGMFTYVKHCGSTHRAVPRPSHVPSGQFVAILALGSTAFPAAEMKSGPCKQDKELTKSQRAVAGDIRKRGKGQERPGSKDGALDIEWGWTTRKTATEPGAATPPCDPALWDSAATTAVLSFLSLKIQHIDWISWSQTSTSSPKGQDWLLKTSILSCGACSLIHSGIFTKSKGVDFWVPKFQQILLNLSSLTV